MKTHKTGPGRTRQRRSSVPVTQAGQSETEDVRQTPACELELKFVVTELARQALIEVFDNRPSRIQHLHTHYYDTMDGQLAAAGISLRLRQSDSDRQWVQTLKVSEDKNIYDRLEDEVSVSPEPEGVPPALDLTRHAKSPAGAWLKQTLKSSDNPTTLAERYVTEIVRRSFDIVEGNTSIEVAFDQGRIIAGEQEAPICELEFELKSGEQEALFRFARRWVAQYGLWLSTESKSARGERLVGLRKGEPVVKASPPIYGDNMSEEALLRAMVRSCLNQIMPNASAVAAGSRDHDHVHQLRVGLRRLRTLLREVGKLTKEVEPTWETPIAEVFQHLGAYRDREAVLESIKPRLLKAGANRTSWMELRSVAVDPAGTVRNPLFQSVLLDILAFAVARRDEFSPEGSQMMRRFLRNRLKRLHERVVDDGGHFKKLRVPAQHQVRKRLKRLRYLSEFAAPLFGKKQVDAYLDNLRPAQDTLGEHNDYAVANELARQAASQGDPDADFALRWLEKQQKQSVKNSQQALEAVAEAPRFWKKGVSVH